MSRARSPGAAKRSDVHPASTAGRLAVRRRVQPASDPPAHCFALPLLALPHADQLARRRCRAVQIRRASRHAPRSRRCSPCGRTLAGAAQHRRSSAIPSRPALCWRSRWPMASIVRSAAAIALPSFARPTSRWSVETHVLQGHAVFRIGYRDAGVEALHLDALQQRRAGPFALHRRCRWRRCPTAPSPGRRGSRRYCWPDSRCRSRPDCRRRHRSSGSRRSSRRRRCLRPCACSPCRRWSGEPSSSLAVVMMTPRGAAASPKPGA